MIDDIANELARIRRQLRNSALFVGGAIETSSVVLPNWLIDQALRIEVREEALLEAWHSGEFDQHGDGRFSPLPKTIMGVALYIVSRAYTQPDGLPDCGWRIIDPFVKPPSKIAFENMTQREKIDVVEKHNRS